MKATVRHVVLLAVAIFAVGAVLATVIPDSQSNKIGSNKIGIIFNHSVDAIVAQQAYGAN